MRSGGTGDEAQCHGHRAAVVRAGGVHAIAAAMRNHREYLPLQMAAVLALVALAADSPAAQALMSHQVRCFGLILRGLYPLNVIDELLVTEDCVTRSQARHTR